MGLQPPGLIVESAQYACDHGDRTNPVVVYQEFTAASNLIQLEPIINARVGTNQQ